MRREQACNLQLRGYPRFEPMNPSDGCKFGVPASAGPASPPEFSSINYQLTTINQYPTNDHQLPQHGY
jgi:hypothetical protein